ncbi:DNA-directed RNA polymerase subunit omega [candidate division KSB1 bacterium]|nr:DNA-directed RNA polymerase subunit omega [candidate division KSB1 bacterium]
MADTLPLEKLEEKVDSLYEAIVIIAKRARQINELQKQLIDKETEANADDDDLDDIVLEGDYLDRHYLKLPKPTTLALQEMLDGKLNFEYIKKNK